MPQTSRSASPKTGRRLLIAEDDDLNRELLIAILELLGHSVIAVTDGEAAVKMIISLKPAAALIDIRMPKKDGLQVVKEIRAIAEFSSLPMIALTAYAIRGDRERCLSAGFDEYVAKPFKKRELKVALDQLLK